MKLQEAIKIIEGFKCISQSLMELSTNIFTTQYCKGSITAIEECLKVLEEVER